MKFTTSISACLTFAAVALALPHQNLQNHCQEMQNTALHCLEERQSGLMYRCTGGKVVDYTCPGDQVCVMFTFGSSTSAACADRPPESVNKSEHSSSSSVYTNSTSVAAPTSIHTQSLPRATPKPTVHSPCECTPVEPSSVTYMNDFLIAYQNQGYFWDVAARNPDSVHRFEYEGVNAEGESFTAATIIQPKEYIEGDLPMGAKLYDCFKKSELVPSWNSDAVIASKCSLYDDNKLIASMEFTASQ
ncbi:hypothetical protein K493DRAFT_321171 [Basidiobolus meristosporus CBS 931.73]|uniref:Uncharacterized protein n=1 Tax=Basidiobolus meristosporus CBS 931.73 TaxID=1314790 RepID=A0A1Y1WZX3_9FUNG|nr:hypothetical protein K493DRAFT_321171 [Basidiobolus meristosporus CBS 931.73]|eukprot:ORX78736.1 hypothetical protein K493DRAFT_321171 [Basidiobolus meristosporus CBS 931.73]